MNTRKTTSIVGVVSVGCLIAFWSTQTPKPPQQEQDFTPGEITSSSTSKDWSVGVMGENWHDEEGQWRPPHLQGRYSLEYRLTMNLPHKTSPIEMTYKAQIEVAPDDKTRVSQGQWLLANITDGEFRGSESLFQSTSLPKHGTAALFEHPTRVMQENEGHLTQARYVTSMPDDAKAVLQGIWDSSQIVATPSTQGKDSWTSREQDMNGAYKATYKRVGGSLLAKTWSTGEAGKGPHFFISRGNVEFSLEQPEYIEALTYTNDITADASMTGKMISKSQIRIKLTRLGDHVSLAWTNDATSRTTQSFSATTSDKKPMSQETSDRLLVGKRNFQELFDNMRKESGENYDWRKRVAARDDLTAKLRLEPQHARFVGDVLRQGKENVHMNRSLLEALSGASTPEAQHEISSLVQDEKILRTTRSHALQTSVFVRKPTDELLTALQLMSIQSKDAPVAQSSIVALGAALHRRGVDQPNANPQYFDDFKTRAEQRLSAAQLAPLIQGHDNLPGGLERQIVTWLSAVGNTRNEDFLPQLERASKAQNPWIRETAFHAMRHLKSERATKLVNDAIMHDDNPTVRRTAIEVAVYFGYQRSAHAVRHALLEDDLGSVRKRAAYCISSWSNDEPGLRVLLKKALEKEKEHDVRETLQNYLTPNRNMIEMPNQAQGSD